MWPREMSVIKKTHNDRYNGLQTCFETLVIGIINLLKYLKKNTVHGEK